MSGFCCGHCGRFFVLLRAMDCHVCDPSPSWSLNFDSGLALLHPTIVWPADSQETE